MKRSEKYPETRTFHFHNENPWKRVTGDCTFRALATAMEKPWKEVVMEMAEMSCRTGYAINDKKGIERYLKEQGWVKHKQPRKQDWKKYTGVEFCELLQSNECDLPVSKRARYIAHIGGHHIVAIVNGQVWDTWDSTDGCIGNYWTK